MSGEKFAGPGSHRGVRIRLVTEAGTVLDVDSDMLHLVATWAGAPSTSGLAVEQFTGQIGTPTDRAPAGILQMWVTPVWLSDRTGDDDDD